MFYCTYIAVKFVTEGQAGNSHVSDQWQDHGLADNQWIGEAFWGF